MKCYDKEFAQNYFQWDIKNMRNFPDWFFGSLREHMVKVFIYSKELCNGDYIVQEEEFIEVVKQEEFDGLFDTIKEETKQEEKTEIYNHYSHRGDASMLKKDKWCNHQIKDTYDNNIYRLAHLQDNRILPCPYKNIEERNNSHYKCEDIVLIDKDDKNG